MNKHKLKGFTLIELTVAIIILAILAIQAAPLFINLNDDAFDSTIVATSASFKSGVDQVHSLWLVKGSPTGSPELTIYDSETITLDGRYGYPVSHNAGGGNRTVDNISQNRCRQIFLLLVDTSFTINHQNASFEDYDIYVRRHNGNPDICHFYFTKTLDSRPGNDEVPQQGTGFTYYPATGEVNYFKVD